MSEPQTKPQAITEPIKRSKLGYAIRSDLIKQCKQIALDEERFAYEVVEELLEKGIRDKLQSRKLEK